MKRIAFLIILYLILFTFLFLTAKYSPTNLAGPGLDFLFYFGILIYGAIMFTISIVKSIKSKRVNLDILPHFIALGLIIFLLVKPNQV